MIGSGREGKTFAMMSDSQQSITHWITLPLPDGILLPYLSQKDKSHSKNINKLLILYRGFVQILLKFAALVPHTQQTATHHVF